VQNDSHPVKEQPPSTPPGIGGPYVPLPSAKRSLNSREDVYWIQRQLQQLGFLRKNPNGQWDNTSREALKDFKVLNQLSHDDVWDLLVEQKIIAGGSIRAESCRDMVRIAGMHC
jgi:peptidoglycan hydrolase-like protein with peptidoglycan-binding domain